jgi:hypothetical protein
VRCDNRRVTRTRPSAPNGAARSSLSRSVRRPVAGRPPSAPRSSRSRNSRRGLHRGVDLRRRVRGGVVPGQRRGGVSSQLQLAMVRCVPVNLTDPSGHGISCDGDGNCRATPSASGGLKAPVFDPANDPKVLALRQDIDAHTASSGGSLIREPLDDLSADDYYGARVQYLIDNPDKLEGLSPEQVQEALGAPSSGWRVMRLGRKSSSRYGSGWKIQQVLRNGRLGSKSLRWSPGSLRGRKGGLPYWRASDNEFKSEPVRGGSSEYWAEPGTPEEIQQKIDAQRASSLLPPTPYADDDSESDPDDGEGDGGPCGSAGFAMVTPVAGAPCDFGPVPPFQPFGGPVPLRGPVFRIPWLPIPIPVP